MFSCCCKLKQILSPEETLLDDILLMEDEIELIFQRQKEEEFDLEISDSDLELQIEEKQINNEVKRVLRMADYVKTTKPQNEISLE